VAILALSNVSCENNIPPFVLVLGVNGNTKSLYPEGSGSSSTVSFPIFSGDKGSCSGGKFLFSSSYYSESASLIFGASDVDNVSLLIFLLLRF
jgi:hypothetical protein